MRLLAVRLRLPGDSLLTTVGRSSSSLAGDKRADSGRGSGRAADVSMVIDDFFLSGVTFSSLVSAIDARSSAPPTVDPLQRAGLAEDGWGESQLDQSLSSKESKVNGVHEKCLAFVVVDLVAGLGFGLSCNALDGLLGVSIGGKSKAEFTGTLVREELLALMVSWSPAYDLLP